jgi:hypothetical protein
MVNGQRKRPSFNAKEEADAFAELKRTERPNQGTAALALPQAIKTEAQEFWNLRPKAQKATKNPVAKMSHPSPAVPD